MAGWDVALGGQVILAAEILPGRQDCIQIEGSILQFFASTPRELLRTRPNPIPSNKTRHLRGVRPAGPPPRLTSEPVTVQRRASNTGIVTVCGQTAALGRVHPWQTVTIHGSETTLAIERDDGDSPVVRRKTTQPVCDTKADRRRTVPLFPGRGVAPQLA